MTVTSRAYAKARRSGSLPPTSPGEVFLPEEDWNVASALTSLNISRHPGVPVPLWHCQNANTAWLGPDVEEFLPQLFRLGSQDPVVDAGRLVAATVFLQGHGEPPLAPQDSAEAGVLHRLAVPTRNISNGHGSLSLAELMP